MANFKHLAVLLLFLLVLPLRAQDQGLDKFLQEFSKALEYQDEKGMDKALRPVPDKALNHFQALAVQRWGGDQAVQPMMDAIKASWARCFEGAAVLDRVERWVESQSQATYGQYVTMRNNLIKCYHELEECKTSNDRPRVIEAHKAILKVADGFEKLGHKLDAAETWVLVSILLNNAPGKTLQDRKDGLFALERFLEDRQAWEWTKDGFYIQNEQFAKAEKERIAEAQKEEDKRRDQGYDADARGVEALVKPDVPAVVHELEFAALKEKEFEDLDYSSKGGPVPAFWWEAQFAGEDKQVQMPWFQRSSLYLVRLGGVKFGVTCNPNDKSLTVEADSGGKPKVTQFFIDDKRSEPYAMWFWTGGDRERLFEVEVNLQWSEQLSPVFYRSAASWHATVAGETVTYYDDAADGHPCASDPFKAQLKLYTLGDPAGTVVPQLDSMRVGKGPRVPFSEFVAIDGAWYHQRLAEGGGKVSVRPLNPDWFKTGKVKLKWEGPKPTAPEQLVIQGRGVYATAFFDVAGGKEVEVPAGEYEVVFGRIVEGKGARVQMASIYKGSSPSFKVEPGKTLELKLGSPFTIDFQRGGSGDEVVIDGARITLRDRSGLVIANLHGMVLTPEVVAAKAADGKGARTFAKFIKLNDPEILNKAATKYRDMGRNVAAMPLPEDSKDGSLELRAKPPFADAKVGLVVKKHPLFGKLESEFK